MRLRGVGRRYGAAGPWVLRGVDLDVPQGALLRFEGANGSGKSTLLRLLAGIDVPSAGRVTGRPRTAYVPERFPPGLPLTARAYLTHMGRVQGLRRPAAARAADGWLERFGAGEYAGTPMDRLSKGTSQKVAVAQALLARPGLLVLDEAWTGLDATARTVLDRAVTEHVAEGGTAVFVDHDPRRLAELRHEAYRVTAGGVTRAPAHGAAVESISEVTGETARIEAETVLIEAEGPPGAEPPLLPPRLPGPPEVRRHTDGSLLLTVPAAASDAILRALLSARPPWHVRSVRTEPESAEGSAPVRTSGDGSAYLDMQGSAYPDMQSSMYPHTQGSAHSRMQGSASPHTQSSAYPRTRGSACPHSQDGEGDAS